MLGRQFRKAGARHPIPCGRAIEALETRQFLSAGPFHAHAQRVDSDPRPGTWAAPRAEFSAIVAAPARAERATGFSGLTFSAMESGRTDRGPHLDGGFDRPRVTTQDFDAGHDGNFDGGRREFRDDRPDFAWSDGADKDPGGSGDLNFRPSGDFHPAGGSDLIRTTWVDSDGSKPGLPPAPEGYAPDVESSPGSGAGISTSGFAGGSKQAGAVGRDASHAVVLPQFQFLMTFSLAPDSTAAAPAPHPLPESEPAARRSPPRQAGRPQPRTAPNNPAVVPPPAAAADRAAPARAIAAAAEPAPHEAAPPVAQQSTGDAAPSAPARTMFDPATVSRAAGVIVGIARAVEVASLGPIANDRVATAVADAADAVSLAEAVGDTAADGAGAAASGLLHLPTGPVTFLGLAPASVGGAVKSWWPTERTWRISAALGLVASLAGYGYCRADVERRKVVAARVAPVVKGRRPDHGL